MLVGGKSLTWEKAAGIARAPNPPDNRTVLEQKASEVCQCSAALALLPGMNCC